MVAFALRGELPVCDDKSGDGKKTYGVVELEVERRGVVVTADGAAELNVAAINIERNENGCVERRKVANQRTSNGDTERFACHSRRLRQRPVGWAVLQGELLDQCDASRGNGAWKRARRCDGRCHKAWLA